MRAFRLVAVALIVFSATAGCTQRIEEDEPGWDCTTMGNLICGPGALAPTTSTTIPTPTPTTES